MFRYPRIDCLQLASQSYLWASLSWRSMSFFWKVWIFASSSQLFFDKVVLISASSRDMAIALCLCDIIQSALWLLYRCIFVHLVMLFGNESCAVHCCVDCEVFWEFLGVPSIMCKGGQCGPMNWIVGDLDFKLSKFDHQLWSDSDSNDEIVLTMSISV